MRPNTALNLINHLSSRLNLEDRNQPLNVERISGVRVKKVNGRSMTYADRHRGNWFKPEYDLTELQIAQDTDSFLFKAIQKKVQRFVLAGWEFVGNNAVSVNGDVVSDADSVLGAENALHGRYFVLRRGKKLFHLLRLV